MTLHNLQFAPEKTDDLMEQAPIQGVTASVVAYESLQLFNSLLCDYRGKDICSLDF